MAETTAHGKYGIDLTLAGYTIESYNRTATPRREEVPNQKNQVVKEIRYDTRHELRLTVRGDEEPSADAITFAGKTYIVDNVEEAGSYNGLQRFNISAHRYTKCSAETNEEASNEPSQSSHETNEEASNEPS